MMQNAEVLKRQIGSFEDLHSIVRTMKALSAVSIHQYERAVNSASDYTRTVELGLYVVLQRMRRFSAQVRSASDTRVALVVFGSDHGLCGRFNEDIVDYALQALSQHPGTDCRTLAVGLRAAAHLEQRGHTVNATLEVPCSASHIRAAVQDILVRIDEWRTQYGVEDVRLYYNRHLSSVGYRAEEQRILPFDPEPFRSFKGNGWPSRVLPTFAVAPERLLASLVGEYLFISLFQACAESQASEHGSRLAAMQSAERNLDERLQEVKGQFCRVRQDAITSELLDLVAGFEAIGGEALETLSQP